MNAIAVRQRESCINEHRIAQLRGIRGFANLPTLVLVELCELLHWRRIEAGQSLMFHDADDNELYLICQGTAQAYVYTETGKEIAYEQYDAGSFVGEVSAIDGNPRPTHVVAATETVIASMKVETFQAMMKQHPCLSAEVAHKMCETIRYLCERIYELSTMPVARRIELELYRIAERCSEDGICAKLTSPPKHADIASRVNTQRESVTKHFSKLKKQGLIRTRDGEMIVPSLEALYRSAYR